MERVLAHLLGGSHRAAVVAAITLFPLSLAGQKVAAADAAQMLEGRLKANSADASAVRELHMLLATPNDLPRDESIRLRAIVRAHSREAAVTLIPPAEPGERIVISGTVQNEQGKPVAGALITVFQTDAKGLYSLRDAETKKMDEPNSRIFGFLRTGPDGRYEFRTVRPGGYPFPLPGRTGDRAQVPAHIHLIVSAANYQPHTCGTGHTCQLVFTDDPRMTPHWREWAQRMTFPVLTLQRDAAGIATAVYDISLRKEGAK